MLKWFICLIRRHDWFTWFDKDMRRSRTVCMRCGGEKSSLFDTDINPNFFG